MAASGCECCGAEGMSLAPHAQETQGWCFCVSRAGRPPKLALNLEPLPNRLGVCPLLPAPEAPPPPLPCPCLLPASPRFNLLPHWGARLLYSALCPAAHGERARPPVFQSAYSCSIPPV